MFAETASDILLSTMTALKICSITETLITVLCFSHTCNTDGTSVRQTLRMGVGLFFICCLINLNTHNELLKQNPIVIYWHIHLNMHNEPVKYDIKLYIAWHKICFQAIRNIWDVHFIPNLSYIWTVLVKKKKKVQQTNYWAGEMPSHFNVQMMHSIYFTVLEGVDEWQR